MKRKKLVNQLDALDEARLFDIKIEKWHGREFVSAGKTYVDFASTNYLGFDFDPYVHERASEYFRDWGAIAGWSRMEVDPRIYPSLEKRLAKFLNHPGDIHISHTITITGFSIIPSIVKQGICFADAKVHTVVYEACRLARDHGAQLVRFKHQDLADLERLLVEHKDVHPKLIAVDGVYSISTAVAPIRELQALCEKYGAWLYVDDAHGFGVLGERPDETHPFGHKGNGVVNFAGGDYRRTFYVSSFGKAFCTYTAFATIPTEFEENVRAFSMQYLFSAPPLPYVLGTVEAMLDLNEKRGEKAREDIRDLVDYFVARLKEVGGRTYNVLHQPVVFLEVGTLDRLMKVARHLWDGGVVAGLRAYPVVPEDKCGLRFALSALHTRAHVDRVVDLLSRIKTDLKKAA